MSSPLLTKAFSKEALLACTGYDAGFISNKADISVDGILTTGQKKLLPAVEGNGNGFLHYDNLTVLYNATRRVPFVSAYNIDGSSKKTVKRAPKFKSDPRIDAGVQLSEKGFFDLWKDPNFTEFEIGHMAANNEMAWGDNAQLQSFQTFHFPNSAPQAENLNTGIWKSLESYMIKEAASDTNNKHICMFTGPVLRDDDPLYVKDKTFRIPLLFFKVVVFMTDKGVFSTAFLMSHEERLREHKMFITKSAGQGIAEETTFFDDFPYKLVFQVDVDLLEDLTALSFKWNGVSRIKVPQQKNQVVRIRKIKDSTDAKDIENKLKNGIVPTSAVVESTTSDEHAKAKQYLLNIILP
jgi:endonuclease G